MLAGSINHISITVTDIEIAVRMLRPFLEALHFVVPDNLQTQPVVCISRRTGMGFNFWRTKPEYRERQFQLYATGLHHIAFNAESRTQVDSLFEIVKAQEMEVLDAPAEWPYTAVGTYYAFYFKGPDGLKFECVHMSALEHVYRGKGVLDENVWADGVA